MTSNKQLQDLLRSGGGGRRSIRRTRKAAAARRAPRAALRGSGLRPRRPPSRRPPGISRSHPRPGQDAGPDRRDRRRNRRARLHAAGDARRAQAAYDAVRAVVPGRAVYHADAGLITLRQQDVAPGQGHDHRRRRRHVRPAGRGRGGVHRRADGQRGRRGSTTSASPGCTACWASASASTPRASSSSSPAWKARCRASSPAWCSAPVIAVPTSIGYGASFGGIAALLGMLNSCASGVSVVNIDNGFGAAVDRLADQPLVGTAGLGDWRAGDFRRASLAVYAPRP